MTERVKTTVSMNDKEFEDFLRLKKRLGLDNDSKALKTAVEIANHYLNRFEVDVPHVVFKLLGDKLHYERRAYSDSSKVSNDWRTEKDD